MVYGWGYVYKNMTIKIWHLDGVKQNPVAQWFTPQTWWDRYSANQAELSLEQDKSLGHFQTPIIHGFQSHDTIFWSAEMGLLRLSDNPHRNRRNLPKFREQST